MGKILLNPNPPKFTQIHPTYVKSCQSPISLQSLCTPISIHSHTPYPSLISQACLCHIINLFMPYPHFFLISSYIFLISHILSLCLYHTHILSILCSYACYMLVICLFMCLLIYMLMSVSHIIYVYIFMRVYVCIFMRV